ncbi:hypothetical protein [Bifidobacterium samirii]|uniref:hypothetical protein n=1 Tax=Bifidobacterium samirii TaxID=2306974 RepID=UPI001F49A4C3|nr:hypothetical protein [Bifidobacterium samirii]
MSSSFKINKNAIRKMREEIQKEINKKPVTIPLYAEPTMIGETSFAASNNTITINAGDNA